MRNLAEIAGCCLVMCLACAPERADEGSPVSDTPDVGGQDSGGDVLEASDVDSPSDVEVVPAEPDRQGPFSVGHVRFEVVDSDRGARLLPLDVWYPADSASVAGASPASYALAPLIALASEVAFEAVPVAPASVFKLIVFSHGYQSISTQSIELMEALASHGFVVASPSHTGNVQGSDSDGFDEAAANRVPDVSVVIDAMLERSDTAGDLFAAAVDPGGVGVVGHSFGGMTAVGVAAGWAGAAPDTRVAAIAPVSAVIDATLQRDSRPGPNAGFDETQLANIALPVLLLGGTEDRVVPIGNNALAFEGLINAPAVYQVDVVGANHTHFANVCTFGELLLEYGLMQDAWASVGAEALIGPYEATCGEGAFPIEEAVRLQSLFVVAFMRYHLLNEEIYSQFLSESFAETEGAVQFQSRIR